jgi:hypothetical protein
MKNHALHFALVFGLLVCGGHTATAQRLSTAAPIIISLSEIDRYGVSVWSPRKAMDEASLDLPYRDMKQSDIETLIRNGLTLNREVWVMDGQRVIAMRNLMGEFIYQPDPQKFRGFIYQPDFKQKTEYGLSLRFDSAEEAQKVGAVLKLEPSLDELILRNKPQPGSKTIWFF